MSGHSKWSQIKRQKGVTDAKRGKLFTKLGREILVAARVGGGDPVANATLRLAVQKAKQANMPKDNIERAIERALGGGDASTYDEITYEAYGPGGVAMLIDTLTDNRNRTVSDVRAALTRAGGNMGETGSVGWVFALKGVIQVDVTADIDVDDLQLRAIDAGAEDVAVDEGLIEIVTDPATLEAIQEALAGAVAIASAEVVQRPTTTVPLEDGKARTLLKLIDTLEDLDDVQSVSTNAEYPDSVLAEA